MKCQINSCAKCEACFAKLSKLGYYISYFGVVTILLWIGVFKFTPFEAALIKPMMENHFAVSWLYSILSTQGVSNLIGIVEIITAVLMLAGLKFMILRRIAGVILILTLLMTLSFLATTPGVWKVVDGLLIADFFILKDVVLLGFSMMILSYKPEKISC